MIAAAGAVAAPVLAFLFAPGFREDGDRFGLTVEMLCFTFPYIFFISLVAVGSGVLNSYGRFATPACNQVLLNVVMILAAGVVAPYFGKPQVVLAAGVFVAGLVQLVALFPALHGLRLLPRPRFDRAHEGVRRIARLMLPGIFGSTVAQVSLLLDTIIASFLMVGSVTWMYAADRLVEFPMGVFAIALATVILPGLSSHHAAESREKFTATLDWALRMTITIVTNFRRVSQTGGISWLLRSPVSTSSSPSARASSRLRKSSKGKRCCSKPTNVSRARSNCQPT